MALIDKRWITASAAAALLGISRTSFYRIVNRGVVTRRTYEGLRPVFLRADVEALLRTAVQPATAKSSVKRKQATGTSPKQRPAALARD